MGSAVQSSPLTSTLTMRAFLTVFLAVAVCGEADPYTIGQVLTGRTAGGGITGVTYPGVGTVAGFPYTAVHHPFVYGKREAEAEPLRAPRWYPPRCCRIFRISSLRLRQEGG